MAPPKNRKFLKKFWAPPPPPLFSCFWLFLLFAPPPLPVWFFFDFFLTNWLFCFLVIFSFVFFIYFFFCGHPFFVCFFLFYSLQVWPPRPPHPIFFFPFKQSGFFVPKFGPFFLFFFDFFLGAFLCLYRPPPPPWVFCFPNIPCFGSFFFLIVETTKILDCPTPFVFLYLILCLFLWFQLLYGAPPPLGLKIFIWGPPPLFPPLLFCLV